MRHLAPIPPGSMLVIIMPSSTRTPRPRTAKSKSRIATAVAPAPWQGPQPARRPMRLCAEILAYALERPEYEPFLRTLEDAIDEYGIGELMVHGFHPDHFATYAEFPKVAQTVDAGRLAALRKQLRRFKKHGIKITLSGGGPRVPAGFFEAYPQARLVAEGHFKRLLASSTAEMFRLIPEADCLEIYLWETPMLNDTDYFKGLCEAEFTSAANLMPRPYYSPAEYITELLTGYATGAQAAGKEFMFLTFSHHPWQERLVIEALKKMDRALPVSLDHKCQPGDWSPYRPANNVMLNVTERPCMLLFDGTGEYWGQSVVPYCYPQEIQQRLWHALEHNPSFDSLGMRVLWAAGHNVFGAFNEVNFYALSRLAHDPYLPIERIWGDWAEGRFGREAAPKVICALERSNRIGNLVYYIHGVWVQNHSQISDFPYLESHYIQYAKNVQEWFPQDFRGVALMKELLHAPREHTIEWVLADRQEALRLNQLSLDDVESVKASLPAGEYRKLRDQFTLQRRFIEVSLPHMEAFLRYRIELRAPSAENRRRFAAAIQRLEQEAVAVENEYHEQAFVLTAAQIRKYIRQVSEAMEKLAG